MVIVSSKTLLKKISEFEFLVLDPKLRIVPEILRRPKPPTSLVDRIR